MIVNQKQRDNMSYNMNYITVRIGPTNIKIHDAVEARQGGLIYRKSYRILVP